MCGMRSRMEEIPDGNLELRKMWRMRSGMVEIPGGPADGQKNGEWLPHLVAMGFSRAASARALDGNVAFDSIDSVVDHLLAAGSGSGIRSSTEIDNVADGNGNFLKRKKNSAEEHTVSVKKGLKQTTPPTDRLRNGDSAEQHEEWAALLLSMGFEESAVLDALGSTGFRSLDAAMERLLAGDQQSASLGRGVSDDYNHRSPQKRVKREEDQQTLRAFLPRPAYSQTQVNRKSSCNTEKTIERIGNYGIEASCKREDGNDQHDVGTNSVDRVGDATLSLLQSRREAFCFSGFNDKPNGVEAIRRRSPFNHATRTEQHIRIPHSESQHEKWPTLMDGSRKGEGNGSGLATNWEVQACAALQKHFGHRFLKDFQKEALEAWVANRDCFILAATGSGKSLCFQLPALMTGKVVVVVSPLISLMHDQCLQLAQQGISACFLGSGQPDKSVEDKAMAGMYNIVYVCPETLQRLIPPLQELSVGRGIALFAVDEAHCVSKWGHDFRPDYRRLSVLREKFRIQDGARGNTIPIMALTATATHRVRADILKSLGIDKGNPKTVLTTFFRPNLQFSVHHSRTKHPSSFESDFGDLIKHYTQNRTGRPKQLALGNRKERDKCRTPSWSRDTVHENKEENKSKSAAGGGQFSRVSPFSSSVKDRETASSDEDSVSEGEEELTVEEHEYGDGEEVEDQEEEDEEEEERLGGDFDARWEDFCPNGKNHWESEPAACARRPIESDSRDGPSIIYVPTRKETSRLAKFFCSRQVKAAAYHAKIPKAELRRVHMEFHEGTLQVVVATIAFGMGIDKPNVRRVIHYGWPQSLEAYYQEAGRAGRDGLPSECALYCDMTVLPSLLPSRRDPEQAHHALTMLLQCYRYGISSTNCRAKMILSYFGEDLEGGRCQMCDICTEGPPPVEDLSHEAVSLLCVLSQSEIQARGSEGSGHTPQADRTSFRDATEKLEKKGLGRDWIWWRGFGRILVDLNLVKESTDCSGSHGNKLMVPTLKFPVLTQNGLEFLKRFQSHSCGTFDSSSSSRDNSGDPPLLLIHPEGDMIQAMREPRKSSSDKAREWGRGWADPAIRRQRLGGRKGRKGKRGKKQRRQLSLHTVRGRLASKLGVKR
ncbi:unnamed protein product [Calypogeia fissa]